MVSALLWCERADNWPELGGFTHIPMEATASKLNNPEMHDEMD